MRRSKKLHRFLEEQGAFQKPRELKRLKREYRRRYQNQWARQNRKGKSELRFTLTKEEYGNVKAICQNDSISPSQLAKELLLSHSHSIPFVPQKETLLTVAKHLGLAINRLKLKNADEQALQKLLQSETLLLKYVNL